MANTENRSVHQQPTPMDTLDIIALCVPAYCIGAYLWKNHAPWRLPEKGARILRRIHFVSLLLTLMLIIASGFFQISLRGVWPDRIIILTLLGTGISYFLLRNFQNEPVWRRRYFRAVGQIPMVTLIILAIPIFGTMMFKTITSHVFSTGRVVYDQRDIRVQEEPLNYSCSLPEDWTYRKYWLIEKRLP